MIYKQSNYNVEIEALNDGRKLMYNTFTGIFGIMDLKTQTLLADIENINDCEVSKSIDVLFKAGYVINADKDELATIKLERTKARYGSNYLTLTIAPTLDCNMCCSYCYEDRDRLVMSKETQKQLVDFVAVHIDANPSIEHISVVWYGGEPLMQKDTIYSLTEEFINLCGEKNLQYSSSIITNGILLDAETAKKLSEDCKVKHVQITIDGMKELHNRRRMLPCGGDSFDIITNNIDATKDYFSITVRVNVDKENIGDIDNLSRYFLEEKAWSSNPVFYLAPVYNFERSCLIESSNCLQGEEFAEIDIKCVRALYANNRDIIASRFFPRRRPFFCNGEVALNYVIGPDGSIYNCYAHMGKKNQRTGRVDKPFLVTSEYGKWLLGDIHIKCEQCKFLPMCMGGCMLFRVTDDGTPECFRTVYVYKDILKLAYEDYIIRQQTKQKVDADK